MSFDWGNGARPTDYGRSGGIDVDAVFNDPRFSSAVQEAIKGAPSMRSVFPHSSIDPRAVIPVQAVTELPGANTRYEGMPVYYHASGSLATGPVWHLVWRQTMNGGSGAWAYIGGDALRAHTFTTYTATGGTAVRADAAPITPPVSGLYRLSFQTNAVHATSASEINFQIGSASGATGMTYDYYAGYHISPAGEALDIAMDLPLGTDLDFVGGTALYVGLSRVAGAGDVSMVGVNIQLTPRELRP